MTWLIIPIFQGYIDSGEFSASGKYLYLPLSTLSIINLDLKQASKITCISMASCSSSASSVYNYSFPDN